MSWYGLIKLLSGVFLAIAMIVGGSFYGAQYLIAQFTAPPPKPIFPNDKAPTKANSGKVAQAKTMTATKTTPKPSPIASPAPSASPTPSVKPSPKAEEAKEYRARIALSGGLNLRAEPDRDSNRVGGVDYNEAVVVLENSPDGEWQRVRIESTGEEGWIKSGYVDRAP